MDWSLVVGVAALCVSLISAIAIIRITRAQAEAQQLQAHTQERLLALEGARERGRLREARRARLVARVVGGGGHWRLIIQNEGTGTARGIRLTLDGQLFAEHDWIPSNSDEVTELGPSGEAAYIMAPHMGSPRVAAAEIQWTDDSGEPGLWTSQLHL